MLSIVDEVRQVDYRSLAIGPVVVAVGSHVPAMVVDQHASQDHARNHLGVPPKVVDVTARRVAVEPRAAREVEAVIVMQIAIGRVDVAEFRLAPAEVVVVGRRSSAGRRASAASGIVLGAPDSVSRRVHV